MPDNCCATPSLMIGAWLILWCLMEPRNTIDSEPLDQVISETLRERLGAPPSREVWSRIAKDIAKPPPRSTFEVLLAMFYTPLAQSAFIAAMLVVIVVQPA